MFGHHFLTIALIVGSYCANYTRVGVIVHVIMDTADIFLPVSWHGVRARARAAGRCGGERARTRPLGRFVGARSAPGPNLTI
jgi:hypothetical protein